MEVYPNKLLASCIIFWHFKYFLKKLLREPTDLTVSKRPGTSTTYRIEIFAFVFIRFYLVFSFMKLVET